MHIVPLKEEHITQIEMQNGQHYISAFISPEMRAQLQAGMSFTALDGDTILGCAGVIEMWEGRAQAWAILSGKCGRNFVGIHRAVASFLSLKQYRRLEATADINFEPGHKWLKMLGFAAETERMKFYLPNGADATMYVRGIS